MQEKFKREEFKYVENPMDYIDEIIEEKGYKICIVNSESWFEQYEDISCTCKRFTPYNLLPDCNLYMSIFVNKYGNKRYHGLALYSTEDSFMEEFDYYNDCVAWLIGE